MEQIVVTPQRAKEVTMRVVGMYAELMELGIASPFIPSAYNLALKRLSLALRILNQIDFKVAE